MADKNYLRRATEVGNRKAAPYNFGSVIVKEGEIIGESESKVHETNDPSAHSEVLALKMAAKKMVLITSMVQRCIAAMSRA